MLFDAHTHVDSGIPGNLCAVRREDWDRVLETCGMVPFLGVHPWYAAGVDAERLRKDLEGYLEMFPRAQVGNAGWMLRRSSGVLFRSRYRCWMCSSMRRFDMAGACICTALRHGEG